jgi:hypothetical protein
MPPFYEKPPGKTRGLFLCAHAASPFPLRPSAVGLRPSVFGPRPSFFVLSTAPAEMYPREFGVVSANDTVKATPFGGISNSTYDFAGPLSCA